MFQFYYRFFYFCVFLYKELKKLKRYENISDQKTQGIDYSVVGSLGRKLRLMFSGSIFWDEINTDLYGSDYDNTAQGQRLRFTTMWNMNPTTEFSFFMFHEK